MVVSSTSRVGFASSLSISRAVERKDEELEELSERRGSDAEASRASVGVIAEMGGNSCLFVCFEARC